MAKIDKLMEGYKRFFLEHFRNNHRLYDQLATQGQSPKTLMISCSDSRVSPILLTDADPGDIFEIRNVANIVPPYQEKFDSFHGTSAAIEFAVNALEVEDIVVMGHSQCGGIRALIDGVSVPAQQKSFIADWVNIADRARARALAGSEKTGEDKYICCEKESVKNSIENLLTFPWIRQKVDRGALALHGWYFSIGDGKLYYLDAGSNAFKLFE